MLLENEVRRCRISCGLKSGIQHHHEHNAGFVFFMLLQSCCYLCCCKWILRGLRISAKLLMCKKNKIKTQPGCFYPERIRLILEQDWHFYRTHWKPSCQKTNSIMDRRKESLYKMFFLTCHWAQQKLKTELLKNCALKDTFMDVRRILWTVCCIMIWYCFFYTGLSALLVCWLFNTLLNHI